MLLSCGLKGNDETNGPILFKLHKPGMINQNVSRTVNKK